MQSKIQQSNRIEWIDAIKGLAMILIVWGHCQQPSSLKLFLTSFHVPVFFALSGILFTIKNGGGKNVWKKLLIPYITFSLLAVLCYWIYDTYNDGFYNGLLNTLIRLYQTITGYGILALWFIPSYVIACYIFSQTFKVSLCVTIAFMLISIMIGTFGSFLLKEVDVLQSSVFYFPIAAAFRSIACCYYVILGKLIYIIFCKIRSHRLCTLILCVTCALCFVLNVYYSSSLSGTDFSMMNLGNSPLMVFLNGTLGSLWVIIAFYFLRKLYSFPIMQYVGKNSMIVMGTHMSLLLTLLIPNIVKNFWQVEFTPSIDYYLFGGLCVVLIMIVEIPLINLLNGKFKCLIKKF